MQLWSGVCELVRQCPISHGPFGGLSMKNIFSESARISINTVEINSVQQRSN